jgi:hypothetical protein
MAASWCSRSGGERSEPERSEHQGAARAFSRLSFSLLFPLAVEYLLGINGMNWYCCIGFDASGAAVVKGEGNS